MDGFDPSTSFGPDVARRYDDDPRGDEPETVELLASLARGGPALELAIGTGRIALPLAAQGIRVDGIELSPDMLRRLRDKSGGDALDVVCGDMAVVDAPAGPSTYQLVYLVFNTIFNILTQEGQVRCFANAARHLTDDGVFLVEAGVPEAWLRGEAYTVVERLTNDEVVLDIHRYDRATQILDESHVSLTDAGVRLGPISCRLAWPGELDLMARLAGLHLVDRWGGWRGEPFTRSSERHVSVYAG